MSEIYTLTSASLFGLILRLLGDADASASVLKSVYARIWDLGQDKKLPQDNSMNFLRATAHRMSVDYKVKHKLKIQAASALESTQLVTRDQLSEHDLSEKEFALLKLVYLNSLSLSSLAKSNDCSEEEMKRRIKKVISKIGRARHEHS